MVQIPKLNGGFAKTTTIRAIPVIGGQYVQSKFFSKKKRKSVGQRSTFDLCARLSWSSLRGTSTWRSFAAPSVSVHALSDGALSLMIASRLLASCSAPTATLHKKAGATTPVAAGRLIRATLNSYFACRMKNSFERTAHELRSPACASCLSKMTQSQPSKRLSGGLP